MQSLSFEGKISDGCGQHQGLGIPGYADLGDAPKDWPHKLYPGSLNVEINPDGFPEELEANVAVLDAKRFKQAIYIDHNAIENNTLHPKWSNLERGSAQVWRAELTSNDITIHCWVLRRIGSRYKNVLEVISDKHLRDEHKLKTGQPVTLSMLGQWQDTPATANKLGLISRYFQSKLKRNFNKLSIRYTATNQAI